MAGVAEEIFVKDRARLEGRARVFEASEATA
jgi:hypothetical protein